MEDAHDTPSAPPHDAVLRAFTAIEITEEVRKKLSDFQQELRNTGVRVAWVAPANIHLTLVFLGDIFTAQVEPLSRELDTIAGEFAPLSFEVAGAGWFGSARAPRVIWVGVREEGGGLEALQARVQEVVEGQGIRVEKRGFKPHLTIGRVRVRQRVDALTSLLGSANNTTYGSVPVHRLLLMQSRLAHQGVRYSVLHAADLKGAR